MDNTWKTETKGGKCFFGNSYENRLYFKYSWFFFFFFFVYVLYKTHLQRYKEKSLRLDGKFRQ